MTEKNTWESTIILFLLERKGQKEFSLLTDKKPKKALDDKDQAIIVRLLHYLGKDEGCREELEEIENRKNAGKNKVSPLEFQKKRFKDLISLDCKFSEINEVVQEYEKKIKNISDHHAPSQWISWAAEHAKSVSFATHVAKLTHPSIKRASSFYINTSDVNGKYLDTSSLISPDIDDAVDNAAYTPVASFLKLAVNNRTIGDCIVANETSPFDWITNDKNKISEWMNKFSEVFKNKNPASHSFSKQVYFPITHNMQETSQTRYHLLCNVQSSSLAQSIFNIVNSPKEAQGSSFREDEIRVFPHRASLFVTASLKAHKNVSPLNSRRNGRLPLLSTQPPVWQSNLKPPIGRKSFLGEIDYFRIREILEYLRDFLLRFQKINVSIKDPKRKKWIDDWVNQIIDEVMNYAISIQQLPAGWTKDEKIKLKPEHQYLLDPFRDDELFQKTRDKSDWKSAICKDFANWLNRLLSGKDKQFTPQKEHTKIWKDLMEIELREHVQDIKWDIKKKSREG